MLWCSCRREWTRNDKNERINEMNEWMNERAQHVLIPSLICLWCFLYASSAWIYYNFICRFFYFCLFLTLSFWFATWFSMRCTLQSVHTHSETHASNIVVILPRVACAVTTTSNDNEPREREGERKKSRKNEWIRSSSSLWTCAIVCPKYLLNELLILDWRRRRR